LCGGVALYFGGLAAIRLRIGIRPRPAQVAAVVAALAVIPLALEVRATVALATLAAVTTAAAVVDAVRSEDRVAGSETGA
jgi:hypothetical protein